MFGKVFVDGLIFLAFVFVVVVIPNQERIVSWFKDRGVGAILPKNLFR